MIFTFIFKTENSESKFNLEISDQENQTIVLSETKTLKTIIYTSINLSDKFIGDILEYHTNNNTKSIEVMYDNSIIMRFLDPEIRGYITNENNTLHKRLEITSEK